MRRCTAMSDQTQGTFTSDLSALVAHVKRETLYMCDTTDAYR
jgi:hypothetical protein